MATEDKFEKIIHGWERCKKCDISLLATLVTFALVVLILWRE